MKKTLELIIIPSLIAFSISFLVGHFIFSINAQETKLTATVPENEINHCVKVLQDAGYIK